MAFNTYQSLVIKDGELVSNSEYNTIFGNRVEVNTKNSYGQREAFLKSSVVQTAVKKRVNAFSNLNIWAKDRKGNKVDNKTVQEDLNALSRWNSTQNFNEFNASVEAQASVYGLCYVYKTKVLGLNEYDYYVIPFHLVSPVNKITRNNLFETQIDYFNVEVGDNTLRLEKDEVIVFRDNWINSNRDTFGLSRLYALSEPISTLLSIGEMTTQLIADGGARGIIGQGAKDIDTFVSPFLNKERDEIQKQIKKYGGLREQFKYIVTKGQASYVPLTSKIVDMQLPELAMKAKVEIFDAMGIPAILAMHEPRFKAAPEARKEFYTATIIPEASARFRDLVKAKNMPTRDWQYQPDWSQMDFFQESLKEGAVAIQQVINGLMPAYNAGLIDKEKFNAILEPYLE